MFNNISYFNNTNLFTRLTENVVVARCICLLPALEMANHTLQDLGDLIGSFIVSHPKKLVHPKKLEVEACPLAIEDDLPPVEENEVNERDLKERRWNNVKNLTADIIGVLFFGVCAFHRSRAVAVAGVLSFLVYAKLNWKKEGAGSVTFWTGLGLTLLSHYKVKIIKSVGRGVYRSFQWITHATQKIGLKIIHGIKHIKNALKSVAKVIAKVFKVTIQYPFKFIKATVHIIGKVASKSLAIFKPIGHLSVKVVSASAKLFAHAAEFLFKHPYIGIALVGTALCGVIALKGGPLLAHMGTAIKNVAVTIAKGAIVVGRVALTAIVKIVLPIFTNLFKMAYSVVSSIAPLVLKLVKVIPTVLQFAVKAVWVTFSTIISTIFRLFLKVIIR